MTPHVALVMTSGPAPDPAPAAAFPAGPWFGVDIGGTKCAVSVLQDGRVHELERVPTRDFEATFAALVAALRPLTGNHAARFGISCGGPLDTAAGAILSPPNLPASWHGVPIVARLTAEFGGQAALMNDANACALAEWRFGAGRGTRNMIFLTSGTGMGSGLILDGRLYEGTTGDAGEIGHVRLRAEGPVGYNKAGSVEGFTSGGGIARLAESLLAGAPQKPAWAAAGPPLTLKRIAEAAAAGDAFALGVMRIAGERLGETLAILIDLFNPERVVIGGFFPRCRDLLEPHLRAALEREALPIPRRACTVVPAELGETIGSHGAVAAALHVFGTSPS
jgi:glucokinase